MLRNKTQLILLAGAVLFLFAGCTREVFREDTRDGALLARIEGGRDTKVSFDSIEGKFAWTAGDEIAVWYTNGTGGSFTNLSVNPADGAVVSSSTTAEHRDFYAIYPATDAVADNTALQVTLPDNYDITAIIAGTKTEDFSPVPMVAWNTETSSILDFYHVGGLLRLILREVPAGAKTIKVTTDKDITGTYSVSNAESLQANVPEPTITTAGTASNNVVTFTVSEQGLAAEMDELILNLPVPCGSYASVRVDIFGDDTETPLIHRTYDNKPLVFRRYHGKKLDIGELAFKFYMKELSAVTTSSTGGSRSFASSFYSYRTDGIITEPVPFTLEFSEDGGETWSTTVPSWLVLDQGIDYNGNDEDHLQSLKLKINAQVNNNEDPHHDVLAARTEEVDFDLSLYNVATGETLTSAETANCYLVKAPGTYRFPLVYGNGLKNGLPNAKAYQHQIEDGMGWPPYRKNLVDHIGTSILQPYIAVQHPGTTFTAKVLWTDIPGLVTDAEYCAGDPDNLQDDYISFSVPKETISQGNALIALFAADDIAWSWHIWVTDDDMTDSKKGLANGFTFAPYNLGWQDERQYDYLGRTCQVRAVQAISLNQTAPVTITQQGANVHVTWNSMYYQYGRKDPLYEVNTQRKKFYYPSGNEYEFATKSDSHNLAFLIKNPTALYNSTYQDVLNLWNNNAKGTQNGNNNQYNASSSRTVFKTIYDPSPVGYKIPNFNALVGFTNHETDPNGPFAWENGISNVSSAGRRWTGTGLFFPALGTLSAGKISDNIQTSGFYGTCHVTYNLNTYGMHINSTTVNTTTATGLIQRSTAFPVRPILDN